MSEQLMHEMECPKCRGKGKLLVLNGRALREIREAKNISLREMARRLELSAAYVSDIELGRRAGNGAVKTAYQQMRRKEKQP